MNEKPGWFHISKTSGNKRLARSMLLILCAAISLIFTGAFVTYAVLKTVRYRQTVYVEQGYKSKASCGPSIK